MVNALQAGQIQTVDNLPYNLIDTIEGAGGGVLVSETGAWVPFTMRVDQAPFTDVRVRQAMRLIVDRQQMIDQTLSGYGSLGNDMYAPFDVAYASDLPQREQDIDQAKSLLGRGRARRASRSSCSPATTSARSPRRRPTCSWSRPSWPASTSRSPRRPRSTTTSTCPYTFAQDFWNTRNYIPQAVVGTFPPEQGGTYNETHWDNQEHRDLVNAGGPGARRGQAGRAAPRRPGDRVQRGRPDHLGVPPAGRRLRRQRPGPRAEQVPPARVLQVQQGVGLLT